MQPRRFQLGRSGIPPGVFGETATQARQRQLMQIQPREDSAAQIQPYSLSLLLIIPVYRTSATFVHRQQPFEIRTTKRRLYACKGIYSPFDFRPPRPALFQLIPALYAD
jgi:hypothetical protein